MSLEPLSEAEIRIIEGAAAEAKGNLDLVEGIKKLAAEVRRQREVSFKPVVTPDQAKIAMQFLEFECQLAEATDDTADVRKVATAVVGRYLG